MVSQTTFFSRSFSLHHAYVTILPKFADATNFKACFSTFTCGCQLTVCFGGFDMTRSSFETITNIITNTLSRQLRCQRRWRDITTGSRHDVLWTNWVFWTKMTWHGRRHKSVWDLSRRVWEATKRVYSGSTTGSTTHRSLVKTGTNSPVRKCHIQWFYGYREWSCQWKLKQKERHITAVSVKLITTWIMFSRSESWIKRLMNRWNNSPRFFCCAAQKIGNECGVVKSISLLTTSYLAVSIFNATLIVDYRKITEDDTFWQGRSSQFSRRERYVLDTVVNPENTLPMASQTRLDGPQTDLCRRQCRVMFIKNSICP